MSYYLVQISIGQDRPSLLRDPRRYHTLIRTAAECTGGSLDGCWFTAEGDGIVAVVSLEEPSAELARKEFEKIEPGARVKITSMMSLREILDGARDLRLGEALSELTDPVDIASALSFPASDPPSWQSESVLSSGDVAG